MFFNTYSNNWIMTSKVYSEICRTIGTRKPEQGGILGSSDGKHIDHYYFDKTADCSAASYTMNTTVLNEIIHEWNDNGVQLIGIIHSHPRGITSPSAGDKETAKHIIETVNVEGKFFTPIVQVSNKLNGDIEIYPYTFEQSVEMKRINLNIEKETTTEAEVDKLLELDKKASNRFQRIASIFPDNIMSTKTVICIGCGGSRSFVESLARCGVGNFILFDGDKVEDTNIATQGAYISEIGQYKCDVIKNKILDINPLAKVTCINRYLDKDINDNEFSLFTNIGNLVKKDTILCGCTDNAFAQDRCAQLSLKYGVPYLAAQIFKKGIGHEIIFSYPGVTHSCPRCMLESRYKKLLTSQENGSGSSEGAAICVTDHLNSLKTYAALNILCYDDEKTPYYHELDKYADKSYLMTKCASAFTAPAFSSIEQIETEECDLSFPFVSIAIEQTPEKDCPLCGGTGDLMSLKNNIKDTRNIINNYESEVLAHE